MKRTQEQEIRCLLEIIEEQTRTIQGLNMCIGGVGSTSLENISDSWVDTLQWLRVEDLLPELHIINSTMAMSRSYPVFTNTVEVGYMIKYLESTESRWIVGHAGRELVVTHWINTEGPTK